MFDLNFTARNDNHRTIVWSSIFANNLKKHTLKIATYAIQVGTDAPEWILIKDQNGEFDDTTVQSITEHVGASIKYSRNL